LPLFWGDDRQVAEIALKGFITKGGVRQDAATLAAGFDKGLGLAVYQPQGQMVVSRYGGTGASIRNMLSVALGFLDKQPFYQAGRFGLYQFPPRLEFFSLEVKVQNLQVAGNFAADNEGQYWRKPGGKSCLSLPGWAGAFGIPSSYPPGFSTVSMP